jgi:hypothetical protein
MKYIQLGTLFIFLSFLSFSQQEKLNLFFQKTDSFMAMNVKDGKIDYLGIKENEASLTELVFLIETIKVRDVTEVNIQKAFLINTYNILVIKGLVKKYPINSPTAVTGFFDRNKYQVADYGEVTLNDLENKLIRKIYQDPRVHFVLVCGAASCPPIIDKVYLPTTLENQLETQTKLAINSPSFIRVTENEVAISEIFKWYSQDFVNNKQSVREYINLYREKKIPETKKLSYYTYDWTINEQPTTANSPVTSVIMGLTPSKLMRKGQWDIKVFNNLYTENKSSNSEREVTKNTPRQSFFTSILEVYTGISKTGRVNVGGVVNLRSNTGNNAPATDVFKFSTEQGVSRAGISNAGLAVKLNPFKKRNNISLQSTFFFPVFEDVAGSYYLDRRSYIWENKFFYDKSFLGDKFQLFAQLDVSYHFGELQKNATANENAGERFANNSIAFPVSVFLSYFPSNKFTVYANAQQYQLVPVIKNGFGQEFTVIGLGSKYQLTKRLNIEVSTSVFLRGTSSGLGNTYNLGLRYVY